MAIRPEPILSILVLTGWLGAPLEAADPALKLRSEAVRPSYSRSTPVLVRVTLTNDAPSAGSDTPFFVLISDLTFGRPLPEWPYLQVAFEVVGPDERSVIPAPSAASDKLAEPQLCWFSELHGGNFFGGTVDLTAPWLGFSFLTPGTYTVRTVVSTGAVRWLDAWLVRNRKGPAALPFSYEHVFGGTLAAAPIEIVVAE